MRITSDSSSDLFEFPGVDYTTVPLKVMFGGNEYVDEPATDSEQMVLDLQKHTGPSTTSCPNVHDWLSAFGGADEIFAITISSGLSASYSSAELAADQYRQLHPEAQVSLFDSKATGPVLRLIVEAIAEEMKTGKSFAEITSAVRKRQERIRILYSLESLNNLARNGRVNAHVARIAGALNIRAIGHASAEGKVELLHTCRGEKRALKTIVAEMVSRGCDGGKIRIDHCLNQAAAEKLAALMAVAFPSADISINPCGVLCSYYADKGGLIIGYEVNEGRESAAPAEPSLQEQAISRLKSRLSHRS